MRKEVFMADRTPRDGAEWHAQHPRFREDENYRDAAIAAHHRALLAGTIPDSPAYFDHLDAELQSKFGREHGKTGVAVPEAVREEWEQAAKVCDMPIADYAKEQVAIAHEAEGNSGMRVP